MNSIALVLVTLLIVSIVRIADSAPKQFRDNLKIIKRAEWNAAKPKDKSPINIAVPYVIIHHTSSPPACYTRSSCQNALRSVQRTHQVSNGWDDIGYNFLIGGDGEIYEGRGFGVQGAHAPGFNYRSVGICLIGNWSDSVPPQNMLDRVKELINHGVARGHIEKNYKLHGHSQVKPTECPGRALLQEIETWNHFSTVSTR